MAKDKKNKTGRDKLAPAAAEPNRQAPLVGIIMGSDSDLSIMKEAAAVLNDFNIPFELTIVSAHRTPMRMVQYATQAAPRGLKAIIAGAGGAAHLPGMVASLTTLLVIGVPVATVALNAAKNAGIIAAQIIGTTDTAVAEKLQQYKSGLEQSVLGKAKILAAEWQNDFDQ